MTPRGASIFAIIGTGLWTICVLGQMLRLLSALSSGAAAMNSAVVAVVHFVFALSLLVFFFVFWRSQS